MCGLAECCFFLHYITLNVSQELICQCTFICYQLIRECLLVSTRVCFSYRIRVGTKCKVLIARVCFFALCLNRQYIFLKTFLWAEKDYINPSGVLICQSHNVPKSLFASD